MTTPPTGRDAGFLLTSFTEEVAEVAHAIAVSADGLLLAVSADLPQDRADQASLTQGAATLMEAGAVLQNVVEMDGGFLFLMSIGQRGALVTLAGRGADVGQVGYQMALLVERIGNLLKPQPRTVATAAA